MGLRLCNGLVLAAVAALWMASGTQCEEPVLVAGPASDAVRALEAQVSGVPGSMDDGLTVRQLAQAYLDARAPGLALALIERASPAVRGEPRTDHVYARALLDGGRADAALVAERRVLHTCMLAEGACDTWLVASATRRAEILQELVDLGVEDAEADPERSAIAYHKATREARLALR
jgi:hypothetical protein